jgi:hypothetical protein
MADPRRTHFGDPCIHCGIGHDDIKPGNCEGDARKAIPIGYRSLGVRWDGYESFLIRMSDWRVVERTAHVSWHYPYRGFSMLGNYRQPPPMDLRLTRDMVGSDG